MHLDEQLGSARLNPILSVSLKNFLKMAINPNEWFGFGFFIWMHNPVILYVNNIYFRFGCSTRVLEESGSEGGQIHEICQEDCKFFVIAREV